MQYIQLQGQSAPEMDTPLAGSYNLFIDGSDGSVKIIDDQGNWYGDSPLTTVTYSELRTLQDDSELRTGSYYLISNFRTCYDQPNYDYNGNAITTGNYKQGNVSPIIVFAISSSQISEIAHQPEFPGDIIHYDPSVSVTEVTEGAAFGRITYRKDNQGNSFDYDFREVLFKRYDGYFSESVYEGAVSIDGSGNVTGGISYFTNFAPGNIIGLLNITSSPLVSYYEIVSIADNNNMVVTGHTFNSGNDLILVDANLISGMSWKQNNIISNTNSTEYLTFTNYSSCFNNTCGNTAAYTVWDGPTFFLSNNVFIGGEYTDNSFGSAFRNNTFNDDCISNTIRGNFYNNIITNDFDRNTINGGFYDNVIDCDFQNNLIMEVFYNNNLGDDDGIDFNDNILDCTFYNNFFIGYDHFDYNTIKDTFNQNIILRSFKKNFIGGYTYNNTFGRDFNTNTVGNSFYGNEIYNTFDNNTIGEGFYDNTLGANGDYFSFENNQIGVMFKGNLIAGDFQENRIGNFFMANEVGTGFNSNNIGNLFIQNDIGEGFGINFIKDVFEDNTIGNNFQNNKIGSSFIDNSIDNNFGSGPGVYGGNTIGNNFSSNTVGENFFNNNIADNCYLNVIGDNFRGNQIGNEFYDNNISHNFGFGGTDYRSNVIGNGFNNNTIGEYFYDNTIRDGFQYNTVADDFQFNRIETNLDGIDFTTFVGRISAVTFPPTTGTDGVYAGLTGAVSGIGINAIFTVNVVGGFVDTVDITAVGKLYLINDTVTIASGSFGGDTNLVLTVTGLYDTPMVYESYNKTIQRRIDGTPILTALDNSGSWYISQYINQPIIED